MEYMNEHSAMVAWGDQGADRNIPLVRLPRAGEVTRAQAIANTAFTGTTSVAIAVSLLNGGTAGTATGAAFSAVGGASVSWTKNTPKALTASEGTFALGEHVIVKYDETGTVTPPTLMAAQVDYVLGSPAGAG